MMLVENKNLLTGVQRRIAQYKINRLNNKYTKLYHSVINHSSNPIQIREMTEHIRREYDSELTALTQQL